MEANPKHAKVTSELDSMVEVMRRLEVEAEVLHEQAQQLNKQGRYDASRDMYKKFRNKDDDAIALALAIGEYRQTHQLPVGARPAEINSGDAEDEGSQCERYVALFPPICPSEDEQMRLHALRCVGSVLGTVVGDAAANSVQWVYDPSKLQHFQRNQMRKLGHDGLEFMDPPANEHFEYEVGRNSPYGEQALTLLESLAKDGKLDTHSYAELFVTSFGGDWHIEKKGYRDASCKGFLRNWALGLRPPLSGANDKQINCCVRLAPLLAAFSFHPQLETIVEQATRVTQNHDQAVAWAILGTKVLSQILAGVEPNDAVTSAIKYGWQCGEEDSEQEEVYFVAGFLNRVLALSNWASVHRAVNNLGKNCHTPNSYQTPIHAVLRTLKQFQNELEQHQVLPQQIAQDIFVTCIRSAMQEGGCCASRCGVIGSLLGAYLAGRTLSEDGFIPDEWKQKTLAYTQAKEHILKIQALRLERYKDS